MRLKRLTIATLLASALAACSHAGGGASPRASASLPPMLIDQRGITMPLEAAVKEISFRPTLPPGQVLAFAVIPPLGGPDKRETRGLAAEYASGRVAMVLSEWPKGSYTLAFPGKDITNSPCVFAKFSATGIAWTSRRGLLMTLQPDGNVSARAVEAEARRLIAAGACR